MIAAIEVVNKENSEEDLVIYSNDVKAMYPLLDIETFAKGYG